MDAAKRKKKANAPHQDRRPVEHWAVVSSMLFGRNLIFSLGVSP